MQSSHFPLTVLDWEIEDGQWPMFLHVSILGDTILFVARKNISSRSAGGEVAVTHTECLCSLVTGDTEVTVLRGLAEGAVFRCCCGACYRMKAYEYGPRLVAVA